LKGEFVPKGRKGPPRTGRVVPGDMDMSNSLFADEKFSVEGVGGIETLLPYGTRVEKGTLGILQ